MGLSFYSSFVTDSVCDPYKPHRFLTATCRYPILVRDIEGFSGEVQQKAYLAPFNARRGISELKLFHS